MCDARGLPLTRIGVTDGDVLEVQDSFTVGVDELRTAYEGTLPALFGPLAGATSADPALTR
jgi:phosphoribosylformylglycinamidine synthase